MNIWLISNIAAMAFSSIGLIMLGVVLIKFKIGGTIGTVLKFTISGIFFSVLVHAAFELLAALGLVEEKSLLPVMGVLLTIGSFLFILGSFIALKDFSKMDSNLEKIKK